MTYRGSLPRNQFTSKSPISNTPTRCRNQPQCPHLLSHSWSARVVCVSVPQSNRDCRPHFTVVPELTTPPGRPIKGLPESVTVDSDAPTSEIFRKIASISKFSIHRLRVTKGSDGSAIPNNAGVTVHQTGLRNKSAVDVKDLGMLQANPCCKVHV